MRSPTLRGITERERILSLGFASESSPSIVERTAFESAGAAILDGDDLNMDDLYLDLGVGD